MKVQEDAVGYIALVTIKDMHGMRMVKVGLALAIAVTSCLIFLIKVGRNFRGLTFEVIVSDGACV